MAKQLNAPLAPGSRLQQYQIDRVLSSGGFSIVYLAYNEHGIPVAIKEFMPAGMELRTRSSNLSLCFPDKEFERRFHMGLKSFFREAEAISRIEDKAVVRILNFFLANDTAYLVMPFEHGRTLQRIIVHSKETLNDVFIQRIFCDSLRALSIFHANQILHLDLKPSNIWIRSDNSAMIIDFGTSRIGKEKSHLPPMHTPGFAAPEQHRKYHKNENIGPWTDIYNLAATIYSCIEGTPPPSSEQRMDKDKLPLLEQRWAGQYSGKLLRMLDRMLRLDIAKRPADAKSIHESMTRYTPMPSRDEFLDYSKQMFF